MPVPNRRARSAQTRYRRSSPALTTCGSTYHLRILVVEAGYTHFPDEEIDFLSTAKSKRSLNGVVADLDAVRAPKRARQCLLREGMKVVIAGRPNAGKSSLLNAAGRSGHYDIAGTTARRVARAYCSHRRDAAMSR